MRLSFDAAVDRRAKAGWQCPECYGVQVNQFEHVSLEKRFECNDCGATWRAPRD